MKKFLAFIKKRLNYVVLVSFILITFSRLGKPYCPQRFGRVSGLFSNFLSAFFHMIGRSKPNWSRLNQLSLAVPI
jgi:hypothetical protein